MAFSSASDLSGDESLADQEYSDDRGADSDVGVTNLNTFYPNQVDPESDPEPLQPSLHMHGVINMDGLNPTTTREALRLKALATLVGENTPVLDYPHKKETVNTWRSHDAWVECFPFLFPFGVGAPVMGDLNDANDTPARRTRISYQGYFKHVLRLADNRFATDPCFMFFAMNSLQLKEVLRSCTTSVKSNKSTSFEDYNITAKQTNAAFKAAAPGKTIPIAQLPKELQRFMRELQTRGGTVRGTDLERLRWRQHIRAYMLRFGLPCLWYLPPLDPVLAKAIHVHLG
jgi:hypothetical protein